MVVPITFPVILQTNITPSQVTIKWLLDTTQMGDCQWRDKISRNIQSTSHNSAFRPSSTGMAGFKSGHVHLCLVENSTVKSNMANSCKMGFL